MLINVLHMTEPDRGSDSDRRTSITSVSLSLVKTIAFSIIPLVLWDAKSTESVTRSAFSAADSRRLKSFRERKRFRYFCLRSTAPRIDISSLLSRKLFS